MRKVNTYDITAFKKKTAKLIKQVQQAAEEAVTRTVELHAARSLPFDEVSAVPYVTNERGNIVLTVTDTPIGLLEEIANQEAEAACETMRMELERRLKGVLR